MFTWTTWLSYKGIRWESGGFLRVSCPNNSVNALKEPMQNSILSVAATEGTRIIKIQPAAVVVTCQFTVSDMSAWVGVICDSHGR